MSLNKSFIAVFHAFNITVEAFNVNFEILDVLFSNSCSLIIILVLNDLTILLTEELLLKFN